MVLNRKEYRKIMIINKRKEFINEMVLNTYLINIKKTNRKYTGLKFKKMWFINIVILFIMK